MTLNELKSRLPEELQPWVEQYGPIFLDMGSQAVKDWLEQIEKGNIYEARVELLRKMTGDKLVDWSAWNDDAYEANKGNAAKIALQKEAGLVALKAAIRIAAVAVGL